MHFTFPHSIDNGLGENLIFKELQYEQDGDRLIVENYVAPGVGPVMHTHWLQDESLTVESGQLAYQFQDGPVKYAEKGESIVFTRGQAHRFWNSGTETLHCTGWLKPANTIVFFLSAIYNAQIKSGKHEPERFDAAYLVTRYHTEYDLQDIPPLVKKVIIPATYYLGRLLGKYKHFKNAPEPVRAEAIQYNNY